MRDEDVKRLSEPYTNLRMDNDRRFHSALGADVPSAGKLIREIFGDLSETSIGISWWSSTPVHERALIGDYLFQCASAIEVNLPGAKLHYLEFLDAREKHDKRIADAVSIGPDGEPFFKHPIAQSAMDDLINKLEGMHVCGFFQAIGSTFDCLGAVIIGVLGLDTRFRISDIGKAERALAKLTVTGTPGNKLQMDFKDFFDSVKASSGLPGWLEWADRYRNMFIHRGRRITYNLVTPRPSLVLDKDGRRGIITASTMHLARQPDKSDAEAMIQRNVAINEDADTTLSGIFQSCRDMLEAICERLIEIWQARRADPSLITQPASQWEANIKITSFNGYDPSAPPLSYDSIFNSHVLLHRFLSAGAEDRKRSIWQNTAWDI
jgi:hypothetical protein